MEYFREYMETLVDKFYVCLKCGIDGFRSSMGSCPKGCIRRKFREANEAAFMSEDYPDPSTLRSGDDIQEE